MADNTDTTFMRRALTLAAKARGRTKPNPMVGAVVVRSGKIVGEGYHHAAGKPHAEVLALRAARDKAAGATIYVTLEPCCHVGRTGPCTEAIVEAGVRRVVFAVADPDHRVNGKGQKCLTEHGLQVTRGVLEHEARQLNDVYFGYHHKKRPYVILKMAQSLDGRIATRNGDSKWISGPPALKLSHLLRADVDAVAVGMGTVRADDPALTVRHVKGANPYRLVVTSSGRFPRGCRLLADNEDYRTIIATSAAIADRLVRSKRTRGAVIWSVKTDRSGAINVHDLIKQADHFGLRSILVEGGAGLATSVLKAKLVDKLVLVSAPLLIGEGTSSVGDLRVREVAGAIRFSESRFETCGNDSVFVGYPDWKRD